MLGSCVGREAAHSPPPYALARGCHTDHLVSPGSLLLKVEAEGGATPCGNCQSGMLAGEGEDENNLPPQARLFRSKTSKKGDKSDATSRRR